MENKNEILELSFDFALSIIEFSELLESNKKYVISRQLLKSGTSIGANMREAQNAHSRNDFISKCVIAMKEADETEYWLQLCEKSLNYPQPGDLLIKILSIKKLLSRIISSSIKNRKNEK
ncbi:four helix bundle protein [Gillisia limnaea]|uniref:CHP02436-containing protein n=1 Tax=Gillisia limnaea (strain DSM 15749 / LMG 21470 / R-8282) TaxID=865937 RepID=H2BZG2_GILLR|nr:four helix bundle protein [Gillisia limnaea]EHQ02325.1 CHP02436-containing protein [Gillisia limnaea DSM 15749]